VSYNNLNKPHYNTRHGFTGTRFHRIYCGMISRCKESTAPWNKFYHAKGVKVCDRWMKFENFKEDMLPTYQDNLEIDRIDNDGNYEPANCRWATRKQQLSNRSNTIRVEYNGMVKSIKEWSEYFGWSYDSVLSRHHRGESIGQIALNPPKSYGRLWMGERWSIPMLSKKYSIPIAALTSRLRRDWTMERALTTPVKSK
jgi:hypothetical protein